MSAKDEFFKTVQSNIDAEKSNKETLEHEVKSFQEETRKLLNSIKMWFEGSPITAVGSLTPLVEDNLRFEVSSLTLQNGNNSLRIVPEGLRFFGVTGVLKVTITNPSRAPMLSEFSIHWKDSRYSADGWVIVKSVGSNTTIQHIEFNQESFFSQISSFA